MHKINRKVNNTLTKGYSVEKSLRSAGYTAEADEVCAILNKVWSAEVKKLVDNPKGSGKVEDSPVAPVPAA